MAAKAKFTDEELFDLITECRTSGVSDFQWCKEHGIKNSTCYAWIKKLRNKGVSIPESEYRRGSMNPQKNEVVKVDIVADAYTNDAPGIVEQNAPVSLSSQSISPTIEVQSGSLCIRFTNDVNPELFDRVLRSLGGCVW